MKVALSKEKVETQLRKLGNTPYELDLLEIELDDNVSLPISLLNQMRRDCIEPVSYTHLYSYLNLGS